MKPVIVNINILDGDSTDVATVLSNVREELVEPGVGSQNGEFSNLTDDELHFLRVFIHCEGKIKEVEKALGVSYPTVKAKLTQLKEKMSSAISMKNQPTQPKSKIEVLEMLQQGLISHEEAVHLLQQKGES